MFEINEPKKIDIREGTIEFWMREGKIIWNDNQEKLLFNIPVNKTGSIFLIKDDDNKLKFFHVLIGRGRTDVRIDVSELSNDEPHHIVVTWSLKEKKIALYIDGGELKAETPISYPVDDHKEEPNILNFLRR